MGILRKLVFSLLTIVLLVSLIGTASSLGLRLTIGSPDNMKALLKDSGFYKSFADIVIDQVKTTSESSNGDEADFNSPLVMKAAQDALSEEFLEKQGNAFIDGNYNWLSGATPKPEFKIDLGPAREEFAQNTGLAVAARLTTLPKCTNEQLAQMKSSGQEFDPYNMTCLPFTTNPDEAGQTTAENLSANSSFLNNAVLTPESLDPSQQSASEPYYQSLSDIPKTYQLLLKSPFILAVVALISLLGVIFLAGTRKKGLKTAGVVLLISGIFLIASKVALDTGFHQLEKKLATSSSESKALQESILNIAEGIEKSMTTYNMYFGIGFLVLSIISFALIRRHTGKSVPPTEHLLNKPQESFVPPTPSGINPVAPKPVQTPSIEPQAKPNMPAPQQIKKKRPPRLIQ